MHRCKALCGEDGGVTAALLCQPLDDFQVAGMRCMVEWCCSILVFGIDEPARFRVVAVGMASQPAQNVEIILGRSQMDGGYAIVGCTVDGSVGLNHQPLHHPEMARLQGPVERGGLVGVLVQGAGLGAAQDVLEALQIPRTGRIVCWGGTVLGPRDALYEVVFDQVNDDGDLAFPGGYVQCCHVVLVHHQLTQRLERVH